MLSRTRQITSCLQWDASLASKKLSSILRERRCQSFMYETEYDCDVYDLDAAFYLDDVDDQDDDD